MDLASQETNGKTELLVDSKDITNLHNDDRNVRRSELGVHVMANQKHLSGGKSLKLFHEARVVTPRDDEEMQRLQMEFANLNPKSPLSPPNLEVETEVPPLDHHYDKPRQTSHMMKAGVRLDARCDPKAILTTSRTNVQHPTDSSSPTQAQPSDAHNIDQSSNVVRQSSSQVQVVQGQAPQQKLSEYQIKQLAANHSEPWKKDLMQKLVRLYKKAQQSKGCVPVAPETNLENTWDGQKKQQFRVQVVENPEDMAITISDDMESFQDLRPENKTTFGNIQPQPELRPLFHQPSSTDTIDRHPGSISNEQLNSSNYNRSFTFLKGHVLPGTSQSLSHLLTMYSNYQAELATGCHGILTTKYNVPTELGEYDDDERSLKGLEFIKVAGRGSYGSVKMFRDKTTKIEFVKKEIIKMNGVIMSEVKILSELNHVNIAQLYGFILRDGTPEILLEYAGISLLEYTSKPSCEEDLAEDKIIEMTYQGLAALEYLDIKGVVHYDIKPENICILKKQNGLKLKITDFGSAKRKTEPPDFVGCTVEYLSPELGIKLVASKYQSGISNMLPFNIDDFVVTTKSDIFSFALSMMFVYRRGHVVISLFNNGRMTYAGLDEGSITKLRQMILVSMVKNPTLVKNVLIPDACCSEMKSILREMVEELPHNRPTATQLRRQMDDVLNMSKTPAEVPYFLTFGSYTEDKHVNLTRQLSSRSNAGQESIYRGAVRNNVAYIRRVSRDHGSLPYGYTGHTRMATNDDEVESHLQAPVPKLSFLG